MSQWKILLFLWSVGALYSCGAKPIPSLLEQTQAHLQEQTPQLQRENRMRIEQLKEICEIKVNLLPMALKAIDIQRESDEFIAYLEAQKTAPLPDAKALRERIDSLYAHLKRHTQDIKTQSDSGKIVGVKIRPEQLDMLWAALPLQYSDSSWQALRVEQMNAATYRQWLQIWQNEAAAACNMACRFISDNCGRLDWYSNYPVLMSLPQTDLLAQGDSFVTRIVMAQSYRGARAADCQIFLDGQPMERNAVEELRWQASSVGRHRHRLEILLRSPFDAADTRLLIKDFEMEVLPK